MTNRTAIITDQQAAGSPQSSSQREPASPLQTMVTPPARPQSFRSPVAETGVVAAAVLSGEGADDSDAHDASRTNAETQVMTQLQPNTKQAGQSSALIV